MSTTTASATPSGTSLRTRFARSTGARTSSTSGSLSCSSSSRYARRGQGSFAEHLLNILPPDRDHNGHGRRHDLRHRVGRDRPQHRRVGGPGVGRYRDGALGTASSRASSPACGRPHRRCGRTAAWSRSRHPVVPCHARHARHRQRRRPMWITDSAPAADPRRCLNRIFGSATSARCPGCSSGGDLRHYRWIVMRNPVRPFVLATGGTGTAEYAGIDTPGSSSRCCWLSGAAARRHAVRRSPQSAASVGRRRRALGRSPR